MTRLTLTSIAFLLCFYFTGFSQSPQTMGQWSDPIEFDIVPVAIANLPDGRLLTWSSKYHDDFGGDDGYTFTQIFDPNGNGGLGSLEKRTVTDTNHDMFCPGINNLPDGRIMVTGGSSAEKTSIYDPRTNVWTMGDDLNIPRGYQGSVTLSDGSIFTIGGSWSGSATFGGRDAELWTEASGWRRLTGLPGELLWNPNDMDGEAENEYRLDNHAWLFAAPNGKIFHAGPGEDMHWIDVTGNNGKGSYDLVGKRGTDHMSMNGNATLFDIGKILKLGGSASYSSNTISNKKSYVIDLNNENDVTVTATGPMAQGRIYVTSVVLPTGEVLVMGGMENSVVFSDNNAHLTAEMFNPETNSFRTLSSMQVPRTYHSTGVLLPDGRVFMGGGGLCGEKCGVNHKDAEIYSPPYLFNSSGAPARRPSLSAPDKAYYGTSLPVTTKTENPKFTFMRFASATHSVNNEQRRVPVTYTGSDGNYQLNVPNAEVMPPGYYMLFVLDGNGVPSIAETVWVGNADAKIAKDNLLVEFDFFEGKGINVNDLSGNENYGTIKERNDDTTPVDPIVKSYWSTNGLSGNSLEMDGMEHLSNTILEIPTSQSLESITNQITVMAWVNRNTGSSVVELGDKIPNAAIFSHDYPRSFFMGYHDSQFKTEFWTTTGGHFNGYTGKRYNPGEWEHFVSTYDGAIAKVYVNGELVHQEKVSGNLKINTADNKTNNTFTLSGFYDIRTSGLPNYANYSGISDELDGRMDKFKLYNVSLTEQEVLAIYNEERIIIKNDNPCNDVTLVYEYSGKRDNGATELTLKEGDTLAFFLEKDDLDYAITSITDPNDTVLNSPNISDIQVEQSGIYKIKYGLKETYQADNLEIAGFSSEMLVGGPYSADRALDYRNDSFWSSQTIRKKGDCLDNKPTCNSTVLAQFPHWIAIKVADVPKMISGLDYSPYYLARDGAFTRGITNYEIYVTNSMDSWGEPVLTGTWAFEPGLKKVIFPETEGKFVILRAPSSTQPGQTTVTAAIINIELTETIFCEKEIDINVIAPRTFVYNGAWDGTGNPNAPGTKSTKYDDIVIESGQDAVFSSNTTFRNLIINEGATLTLEEQKILTFSSITLNSSATAFASLIDKGWIAGAVTYNRFVNVIGTSAGGGNDLVSSPVSGANFDTEFVENNPRLAEDPKEEGIYAFAPYDVENGKYENFDIGSNKSGSIPIVSGKGYRMATKHELEDNFIGAPVKFIGNITRNEVNMPLSDAAAGNGWNLIGNPYPAYVDFESFFNANIDQFDARDAYQAIYAYTGKANQDKWRVLNLTSPKDLVNMAPGQGFYVKSRSGGGLVKFTPEMRTTQGSGGYIQNRSDQNKVLSHLSLKRAENKATTSVFFIEGTTKGLDPGYDAAEFGAQKVDLAIFTNLLEDNKGQGIAIQALPYDDFNNVIVPLGIRAKAGAELSIGIDDRSTLPSNINVYLEDTQNNTLTYLNTKDFRFTPTADINVSGRFNVHYSSKTLSVNDMEANDKLRIYTTAVPKTLYVKGALMRSTTANLYDIQGRLVKSKMLNAASTENSMDISNMSSGVYVVKIDNGNQLKTQKIIIQ